MNSIIICLLIGVVATQAQIDWDHVVHMDIVREIPGIRGRFDRYPGGRIVGGEEAKPGQFPHQVGLFAQMGILQAFCGGSLISSKYVMTAAHCADGVTNFTVVLGAHKINDKTDPARVEIYTKKSVVHPQWSSSELINDIAIIELPEPIKFTDRIKPIRLPAKSDKGQTYAGADSIISGWGKDKDSAVTISPVLRYVENTILSNDDCSKALFGLPIPMTQVCQSGKGKKGACNGDSGGPLTIYEKDGEKTEIGITSYGTILGCSVGLPTAYTRVSEFLDFIEQNTDVKLRK